MSDSVEVAIQRAAAAGAAATGPATPIVIKEDRSIVVPTAMQQIAVQCDNEANVLHFVCPRNWADIDLAAATLYINVVKPDKSTVAFVCTNVVSSEDTITFDWVVTEPVTDVVGKLSFLVCARDPSDPGNGYRWHSNLCDSLFIAPGIACVAPGDTPDPPHIPLYGTDTTLTKPGVPADAAAVGARLNSLSEKITNLPQADWNQNDSTAADYVKNRPFYTGDPVETVFVDESTVSFGYVGGKYVAEFPSTFEATVGDTYKVSWDGTVYECTCVDVYGQLAIGNLSIMGAGSDTGEPFFMGIVNGDGISILTADTSASHTFSISGFAREVVKIDEKYLPENIANKSEVEAAQTTADNAQAAADKNKETLSQMLTYVLTFTFDKKTSGRDTFTLNNLKYYKISDFNPGPEDVISFKGTRESGVEWSETNAGNNCVKYGFFIVVAAAGVCSVQSGTLTHSFTAPSAGLYACYTEGDASMTAGTGEFTMMAIDGLTIKSSTYGSTKKFRITVDDSGLVQSVDEDTGSVYSTMAPAVTAEDNGKFLRVTDGQWAAVAITNAEEVSF